MKDKILEDINKVYKNGYVEYILSKYVKKDYWMSYLEKFFLPNYVENLTDFNYSKCFTMFINISDTNANIGTTEFDKYVKRVGSLYRLQLQISVLVPYATFKYIKYEYKDDVITYSDSYEPFNVQHHYIGDKLVEFLKIYNLELLDEEALSMRVYDIELELREEDVTVYHCLFEDEY